MRQGRLWQSALPQFCSAPFLAHSRASSHRCCSTLSSFAALSGRQPLSSARAHTMAWSALTATDAIVQISSGIVHTHNNPHHHHYHHRHPHRHPHTCLHMAGAFSKSSRLVSRHRAARPWASRQESRAVVRLRFGSASRNAPQPQPQPF